MVELETGRLILRNGAELEPTPEILQQGYQHYVVEHEHPSCPFEVYREVVLFSFFQAKIGKPYGFFNIFPKGMDVSVGHCSFFPSFCAAENRKLISTEAEPHPSLASIEMDIGWAIMKSYRRRGFATEAAQGLIKYGFETLKLPRIVAGTDRDNLASQKVMEKLGLRLSSHPDGVGIIGVIDNPLP